MQIAVGFSFIRTRTRITRIKKMGSGRPEVSPLKYSQILGSLVGEVLLNSMKAKLLIGIKLIG